MTTDDTSARTAIGTFCTSLPQLTQMAAAEGWTERLRLDTTAVRTEPATAPTVVTALWRFLGLSIDGRGHDVRAGLLGHSATPPPDSRYACPGDRCSRTDRRVPGEPAPVCGLFGDAMVWRG
ncbi:hypothetical protein [Dactylosporangium matsuzakiense]|uniref:Uncharacterized protein n=1 Tax=Dactylosporangium matsuzakiense TaxID=53360 RepID=A0A9W6KPY8_9ACTN|nr:hypothetical protein [Dactylosporangium matsuzakiense]GLL05107.1 hypothetical protein GCM10017581_068540 [Dactylosporangium matsuzakiense]